MFKIIFLTSGISFGISRYNLANQFCSILPESTLLFRTYFSGVTVKASKPVASWFIFSQLLARCFHLSILNVKCSFLYVVDFRFPSVSEKRTSFCSEWNDTQLEMLLVCHFGNALVDVCTFHICVVFEPPMPSTNKMLQCRKRHGGFLLFGALTGLCGVGAFSSA